MQVEATAPPLSDLEADLHVLLLAKGDALPAWLAESPGAQDVRTAAGELTMVRPDPGRRVLVAGLGPTDGIDPEALRAAGARAAKRAKRYAATSVACEAGAPGNLSGPAAAAAFAEGLILGSYSFDRFRERPRDEPEPKTIGTLAVAVPQEDIEQASGLLAVARVTAEAQNRARELQNLPANYVNPATLAERAREIADQHDALTATVLGRAEIESAGLGGLVAVSAGSEAEAQLITLRYEGRGSGPVLGLVGKAVTFDSGGISIKPSSGMQEMKMDMSGGAAVLEAVAAIAELGLAVEIAAVVPATENMPSGTAMRPGDIITQLNGKTVEVNNTDAEGRLILADALTWCVREMGADRVVDLATLTGAVLIALGSTYSALISNDDDLASEVEAAAAATGELAWRLPLHPDYKKLTKGTVADLTNAASKRQAGTIYAGSFLEEFVDGKPWAHLDIAGTAWDTEREWAGDGPTGVGVRLLVALAESASTDRKS